MTTEVSRSAIVLLSTGRQTRHQRLLYCSTCLRRRLASGNLVRAPASLGCPGQIERFLIRKVASCVGVLALVRYSQAVAPAATATAVAYVTVTPSLVVHDRATSSVTDPWCQSCCIPVFDAQVQHKVELRFRHRGFMSVIRTMNSLHASDKRW